MAHEQPEAVIFFESAAVGGHAVVEGGNPVRNETVDDAAALDRRLCEAWQDHPRFVLIGHESSFFHKMTRSTRCARFSTLPGRPSPARLAADDAEGKPRRPAHRAISRRGSALRPG